MGEKVGAGGLCGCVRGPSTAAVLSPGTEDRWERTEMGRGPSTHLFDVCRRGKRLQAWGGVHAGLSPSTLGEGHMGRSIVIIVSKAQFPESSAQGIITGGACEERARGLKEVSVILKHRDP